VIPFSHATANRSGGFQFWSLNNRSNEKWTKQDLVKLIDEFSIFIQEGIRGFAELSHLQASITCQQPPKKTGNITI